MSSTSGLSNQDRSVGPGRAQKKLSTPAGASTSDSRGTTSSRNAYMTPSGALRGARTTTALPDNNGVTPNNADAAGAFRGGFTHTTPSATCRTVSVLGPTVTSWCSCVAQYSRVSGLNSSRSPATCQRANAIGLPSATSTSTSAECFSRNRSRINEPSRSRVAGGVAAHTGAAAAAALVAASTVSASATDTRPTTSSVAAPSSPCSRRRLRVRLAKTSARTERVVTVYRYRPESTSVPPTWETCVSVTFSSLTTAT